MKPSPWKPGHFYSPIPGDDDIARAIEAKHNFKWTYDLPPDVDLIRRRTENLITSEAARLYDYLLHWEKLYSIESQMFVLADAIALWGLIANLKPKRIIEVGSGHSTALMLDAKHFYGLDLCVTCIEPFPSRLQKALGSHISEVNLLVEPIQEVRREVFDSLDVGDLLFVDSSHVSKAGSDVNHLLFNVIPNLPRGCYVHIHDIFKGFEYPEEWLRAGRSWNEAYLLRAFLMFNSAFSIYAWPQLLKKSCGYEEIAEKSGLKFGFPGSSLYLKRN